MPCKTGRAEIRVAVVFKIQISSNQGEVVYLMKNLLSCTIFSVLKGNTTARSLLVLEYGLCNVAN